MSKIDYDKTRRWLLAAAERQVNAAGSRATFISDMFFDAAEAIKTLREENAAMAEAAEPIAAEATYFENDADEDRRNGGYTPTDDSMMIEIPLGQLRALRSALLKAKGEAK